MARTRNIKPSFFKNETLSDLGFDVMVCFAGLWTLADREGRLEDRPRWIKAEIFPYAEVSIDALLSKLNEHGFIIRYESGGHRYISVPNFVKHQHPNVKENASTIPAPCPNQASTKPAPSENQSNTPLYPIPYTSVPHTLNAKTELFDPIEILQAIQNRHPKSEGAALGIRLLAQVIAEAVDPQTVATSIDIRHRDYVATIRDPKYAKSLANWARDKMYLDPPSKNGSHGEEIDYPQ